MPRIKLKLSDIVVPNFLPAFDKLGEQDVPSKDKYALARSRRDIVAAHETFESERIKLVKKHGKPNQEILATRIAELKALPPGPQVEQQIKVFEANLAHIKSNDIKQFSIDQRDEAAKELFEGEIKGMMENTVEIYLDHPIVLPDKTNLTSAEISLLLDIVELAPEPAAAK